MPLSKNESAALRAEAIEAVQKQKDACLALGRIAHIASTESITVARSPVLLINAWGFNSVEEWGEHELGVHKTTIVKYMKAYSFFVLELKSTAEELQGLSITKLLALTRVMAPSSQRRHIKAWMKVARESSCCELDNKIEEAVHGETRNMAYWGVQLPQAQKNKVQEAILSVIAEVDDVHTVGDALTMMLDEWMAMRKKTKKLRAA